MHKVQMCREARFETFPYLQIECIILSVALFAATTADRFFRIDRGQEHLHYVTDISSEDLYVMDPELQSSLRLHSPNARWKRLPA